MPQQTVNRPLARQQANLWTAVVLRPHWKALTLATMLPQNPPAELRLSRLDEPKAASAPAEAFMRHVPQLSPR